MVRNLQTLTGLDTELGRTENQTETKTLWSLVDPTKFHNYLQISKNNIQEGISKISEATGNKIETLHTYFS